MQPKRIAVMGAILTLAIAGNLAYRAYSSKPQAKPAPINTDNYLQQEVEKRLASSGVFADAKFAVSAHDGTVTLTGTVPSEWKRISAGNIASSTPAVLEVSNLIVVREPEPVAQQVWESGADESHVATPKRAKLKGFGRESDNPESRAKDLVAQGNDYMAQKRYKAATNAFRSALNLDPNNYEARSGLQEAQRLR
jgi:tetratricopeptide (TPR) repeat protein